MKVVKCLLFHTLYQAWNKLCTCICRGGPRLSARNLCPRQTMHSEHSKQLHITLTAAATVHICKWPRWVFRNNF